MSRAAFTRKRVGYLLFVISAIGIFIGWLYFDKYNLPNEPGAIETGIQALLDEGRPDRVQPKVIEVRQLGSSASYVALLQLQDKQIGYAQLLRGWNGRFQLVRAGYGSSPVSYEEVETDEGRYGIILGRNAGLQLDHVTAKLAGDYIFTVGVAGEGLFMKLQRLPRQLQRTTPVTLEAFDEDNRVIEQF
ncbi:hypothetical protein [Ectobacillus ponti]|uniref:Uncharacterized protein n=1 Tax=Ectobacillus ponti TaxID=2961894 RepID=A0AA41X2L9_9BACI|nr:hypothetical protein [Ectobacillus ponti]MCP8967776.1 hypothetical protein [Ectobacillus ponti]